jgi:hypothetical protein
MRRILWLLMIGREEYKGNAKKVNVMKHFDNYISVLLAVTHADFHYSH